MFTKKEYKLITKSGGIKGPQKMCIEELLNTLNRYDSKRKVVSSNRKLSKLNLKRVAEIQNISENDLNRAEKLQNKSIDEMHGISKLRGIKSYDNLAKEDSIFSLSESESNSADSNYIKYFNNSTNDYIKSRINNITTILARLGNIVTKNEKNKIRKDLHEIEKKQKPIKTQE